MKALPDWFVVGIAALVAGLVIMLVNWGLAVLWLNKLPTCADYLRSHPEIAPAQLLCHNWLQELVPVVSGFLIVMTGILIVLKVAEQDTEKVVEIP